MLGVKPYVIFGTIIAAAVIAIVVIAVVMEKNERKDKNMEELKSCPFCGKSVAVVSSIQECENCGNFESEDCPECYVPMGASCCMRIVVCDALNGGCGCSTGWCASAEKAVEAWNRRTSDGQ